jgi:nitric oxide reductase subunit B
MVISSLWLQVALLTFFVGFAVLGYLAYRVHAEHPPIPDRVLGSDGKVIFSGGDVMEGQHVFQKYGLSRPLGWNFSFPGVVL